MYVCRICQWSVHCCLCQVCFLWQKLHSTCKLPTCQTSATDYCNKGSAMCYLCDNACIRFLATHICQMTRALYPGGRLSLHVYSRRVMQRDVNMFKLNQIKSTLLQCTYDYKLYCVHFQACAPRYVYFSRQLNKREPVGTCYISVTSSTTFREYSPCRSSK